MDACDGGGINLLFCCKLVVSLCSKFTRSGLERATFALDVEAIALGGTALDTTLLKAELVIVRETFCTEEVETLGEVATTELLDELNIAFVNCAAEDNDNRGFPPWTCKTG